MGRENMITVRGLVKRFGAVTAVDGVSFEVARGEVFGLLGENGAGKTTTLRMLATLLAPTGGEASIDGVDIRKAPEEARRRIGVVFEGGVYDRLTARENIRYFGMLHGLRGRALEARIDELLSTLSMREYADRRAGELSKGMRQKIAIARSLVHDPPVLLMDEPTSGLDVTAALLVHDFVAEAKRQGKTILFSSHNMSEVEKLCDRVGVIHKGKLAALGAVDELRRAAGGRSLEELFVEIVGGRP